MTLGPSTGELPTGEQDAIAKLEFIAYVGTIIPELIILAVSEPEVVEALQNAHKVTMSAIARLEGTPLWKKAGLPSFTST